MNTTEQDVNKELAKQGYGINSVLVRDHEWDEDHMADWLVTLTGPNGKSTTIDYHTGKAHRVKLGGKPLSFRPSFDEWKFSKANTAALQELLQDY